MEKRDWKTCVRRNVADHTHFLTFCCFRRQPFLGKDRARKWFASALEQAVDLHDFALWAWVIMPEHVHLLVHPRKPEYSISGFLRSLKQPVTNASLHYVRRHAPAFLDRMRDQQPNGKVSHRFWQRGGGYDANLWTPKYIWDAIRYIHQNPVRRGLVAAAADWEWSSASDYSKDRKVPLIPLDNESLLRS